MRRLAVTFLLLAAGCAAAQAPGALPPIPPNPNEPVNGAVQMLQTPAERAAGLNLLNIAGQDYTFGQQGRPDTAIEASLQSSGNLRFEGTGTMTEVWSGHRQSWWANFDGEVSGAAYALASNPVPMRVTMARYALLWPIIPRQPTLREIRVAGASVDGKPATCVLVTAAARAPTGSGRDWREAEYCMDGNGLLLLASPVPGVYFHYDYGNALQYAGHTIASSIRVIEGEQTVLKIQVQRLGVPDANDLAALQQAPLRRGLLFVPVFRGYWPPNGVTPSSVRVVHLTVGTDGRVIEAEVVPGDNPVAEQAALARFQALRLRPQEREGEIWIRDAQP